MKTRIVTIESDTMEIKKIAVINAIKALIISLIIMWPMLGNSQGQKLWSLEDCINYARTQNINVKKQLLNIEQYKMTLSQSKFDMLPTLNASASHGYNWGQTVDPYTNSFATERVQSNNFYLSTQVSIFSGFQKLNTMRQNQINLKMSQVDVEKLMNDISLNVTTFYLQALYYVEMLKVNQNQLDITQQQRDRTRLMVEAGTLAQGELLNMDAQVAAAELLVTETQNNLDISLLSLAQLIDKNDDPDFMIQVPDIGEIKPAISGAIPPNDVYNYAVKNQPDILSSELKLEVSKKDLEIARGAYSPSLSLTASWATGYSGAAKEVDPNVAPVDYVYPIGITQTGLDTVLAYGQKSELRTRSFSDQLSDNQNKSLGIHLNIPIFNGLRARTNVNRARIAIENANYDLQLAKNNLKKIIQQAAADANAALKKYQSAGKKVEAQSESYHYAEQKYAVGLLTAVEYNQNKDDLLKARSELVQAKFDFVFKTKILDFYMDKPLTLK